YHTSSCLDWPAVRTALRSFPTRRSSDLGAGISGAQITVAGRQVPFGTDLLFAATDYPDLVLGVEICEDMWVPVPPAAKAALAGRSEEHTSELQSRFDLVCRLLLEKKNVI